MGSAAGVVPSRRARQVPHRTERDLPPQARDLDGDRRIPVDPSRSAVPAALPVNDQKPAMTTGPYLIATDTPDRRVTRERRASQAHRLLVDTVALAVPGAEGVSITEPDGSRIHTLAGNSTLVWAADQAQHDSEEGPCLSAAVGAAPLITSNDLPNDPRWPTFGALAARLGVGSILVFRLTSGTVTYGSLNLYGLTPHAFTDTDRQLGQMFAEHAALTMATYRLKTNLEIAMRSRDIIGQAKGILIERFKLTDQQAFQQLKLTSQQTNRRLQVVAEHLVISGEL